MLNDIQTLQFKLVVQELHFQHNKMYQDTYVEQTRRVANSSWVVVSRNDVNCSFEWKPVGYLNT